MNIQISERGNNKYASLEQIQAVWSTVSLNGATTIRKIARQTNICQTQTAAIMRFLVRAGYVKHRFAKTGWNVIIPFVLVNADLSADQKIEMIQIPVLRQI